MICPLLADSNEGPDCEDIYTESECAELASKNLCMDEATAIHVRANCAATCGVCRKVKLHARSLSQGKVARAESVAR